MPVRQDPSNWSADKPSVWFHSDGTNYLVCALVDATTAYDVDAHLFEAPEVAQKRAEQLLEGIERPVVIPLRVSTFDSDRNTELEVMTTAARDLELSGHTPIFIPDQENMGHFQADELPGIHIREAVYSLQLRLALLEKAAISICSSSGPTALLTLAKKKPTLVVVRPIIETSVDSAEMAVSLSAVLDCSPESWLLLQGGYDLFKVRLEADTSQMSEIDFASMVS
jgi:hypothetical protein